MRNFDTTLYFITDSTGFSEEEFLRRTEEALKGGASFLQLREKDKTTREYSDIYESYVSLSQEEKENLPVIPNKFDVPLEKVYSTQMQELYGSAIENIENSETSYDLRNHININVEDQKDFGKIKFQIRIYSLVYP